MSEYKDVIQFVTGLNGKVRANRLGSAKEHNGSVYIKLDMLPIPAKNRFDDLTVELVIKDRLERGEYQQSSPPQSESAKSEKEPDDDIPF
jgi:hypothetical protein